MRPWVHEARWSAHHSILSKRGASGKTEGVKISSCLVQITRARVSGLLYSNVPELSHKRERRAMERSLKELKIRFSEGRQERSKQTLENLLQAAEEIVAEGDVSSFDARTLVRRSGYALGSLINRLGAVENVFLYAIAKNRSKQLERVACALIALGIETDPRQFAKTIVDESFRLIEKVNPSVMQFYEKRALARSNSIASVHCYTDEIIEPLLRLIESNQGNTFRALSRPEARYVCRSIFLFVERPYLEGDPIAGDRKSVV